MLFYSLDKNQKRQNPALPFDSTNPNHQIGDENPRAEFKYQDATQPSPKIHRKCLLKSLFARKTLSFSEKTTPFFCFCIQDSNCQKGDINSQPNTVIAKIISSCTRFGREQCQRWFICPSCLLTRLRSTGMRGEFRGHRPRIRYP